MHFSIYRRLYGKTRTKMYTPAPPHPRTAKRCVQEETRVCVYSPNGSRRICERSAPVTCFVPIEQGDRYVDRLTDTPLHQVRPEAAAKRTAGCETAEGDEDEVRVVCPVTLQFYLDRLNLCAILSIPASSQLAQHAL